MSAFYAAIRSLLFRLDPERAHDLVFTALRAAEAVIVSEAGRRMAAASWPTPPWSHPSIAQELWGVSFPNPVGLAAGLDKNAVAPHVWPWLGFGFAELGTVTALAQPGNPRPRLFRLPEDRALINRMGFNNQGAAAVARRLRRLWRHGAPRVPVGINIGKSKATALDAAPSDYAESFRLLFPFASYVALNVSSPNTPGLRNLQSEGQLSRLLAAIGRENQACAAEFGQPPRPLLVKLAPDLGDDGLAAIVRAARDGGAAGLIATNTTLGREGLRAPSGEGGGLSGAPLRDRATEVIRHVRGLAGPGLPIIGVGGIETAADAYAKVRAGASLVQIYTGMIYHGPLLAERIARGLVDLLRSDGLTHLGDAVGRDG